jgi:hypothetical protein
MEEAYKNESLSVCFLITSSPFFSFNIEGEIWSICFACLLIYSCTYFRNRVSLCSPDWPRPRNSTSASQVLDLQAFATTPAGKKILSNVKMLKSMFKRMLKSFVVLWKVALSFLFSFSFSSPFFFFLALEIICRIVRAVVCYLK